MITITVEGGIVQNAVDGFGLPISYRVADYDCEDAGTDEGDLLTDANGDNFHWIDGCADDYYTRALAAFYSKETAAKGEPRKCPECGSVNLAFEGFIKQDEDTGDLFVVDLCDKGHMCEDCDMEVRFY